MLNNSFISQWSILQLFFYDVNDTHKMLDSEEAVLSLDNLFYDGPVIHKVWVTLGLYTWYLIRDTPDTREWINTCRETGCYFYDSIRLWLCLGNHYVKDKAHGSLMLHPHYRKYLQHKTSRERQQTFPHLVSVWIEAKIRFGSWSISCPFFK